MSKEALSRIARSMANTTNSEVNIKAGTSMRKQNESGDFHLMKINVKEMLKTYKFYFPALPPEEGETIAQKEREAKEARKLAVNDLIARYKKHEDSTLSRVAGKQEKGIALTGQELFVETAKQKRDELILKTGHPHIIGGKFNTLQRVKGDHKNQYLKNTKFFQASDKLNLERERFKKVNKKGKVKNRSALELIAGKGEGGQQIEHGGAGGAATGRRTVQFYKLVEKEKPNLHPSDYHQLSLMAQFSLETTVSIDKKQDVDANGKLSIDYIQEVELIGGFANQEGQVVEKNVADILDLSDYVAEGKGSPSLRESLEMTILFALAGKPSKRKKVTGKKARKVSVRGQGKGKSKKATTRINYRGLEEKGHSRGIRDLANQRVPKRQKRTQAGGLDVAKTIGILNNKLPETVRKNMDPPALQNRTGRFASSVKITELIQTAKGFPSIGYTYDRDNYGQYEASSGTRFASPERDPRKLIDQSIREIAVGMAMGRFFTRRI